MEHLRNPTGRSFASEKKSETLVETDLIDLLKKITERDTIKYEI